MVSFLKGLLFFLIWIVLASINYKLGQIARSLERTVEIELPTLTAAVSEISQSIDGDKLPDLMVIDKNNGHG